MVVVMEVMMSGQDWRCAAGSGSAAVACGGVRGGDGGVSADVRLLQDWNMFLAVVVLCQD